MDDKRNIEKFGWKFESERQAFDYSTNETGHYMTFVKGNAIKGISYLSYNVSEYKVLIGNEWICISDWIATERKSRFIHRLSLFVNAMFWINIIPCMAFTQLESPTEVQQMLTLIYLVFGMFVMPILSFLIPIKS